MRLFLLLPLACTCSAVAPPELVAIVEPAAAPIEGGWLIEITLATPMLLLPPHDIGTGNVTCNIGWRMDSWAVPTPAWAATVSGTTVRCGPMPRLPAEGPVDVFVVVAGMKSNKLLLHTFATFSASVGMTPYFNAAAGQLLYKVNDTTAAIKPPYTLSALALLSPAAAAPNGAPSTQQLLSRVNVYGGDAKLAVPLGFASLSSSCDVWLNLTLHTPQAEFHLQVRLLRVQTEHVPASAVAIDHSSRALVVGGQPFFPISWMTTMDSFGTDTMVQTMATMARKGANSIMIYNLGDVGADDQPNQLDLFRVSRLMDAAQALGLKVQLHIIKMVEPIAQGTHCHREPFGPCSKANNMTLDWRRLEAFVTKWRYHPALLSWYVADDGSWPGLDAVYTRLRQLDPYHPVTMAIAGAGDAWRDTYLRGADVIQPENYPAEPSTAFLTVQVLSRFPFDWNPRVTCAMAWAAVPGGTSTSSFRVQLYNAVAAGATGDIWFAHRSLPGEWNEPGPLLDESGVLAKEMMQLTPALLSSEVGRAAQPRLTSVRGVSQLGQPALIHALARREASGCVHVIVANNLNEPVQATIAFALGTQGIYESAGQVTRGLVPFEKTPASARVITVNNGSLTEWMGSWSTQVFRFNGTSACAAHTAAAALAASQPKQLVSNGGFEQSLSYVAAPSGWSCEVSRASDRACFATAEMAHTGRRAGRFTTGEDFGSLRIRVPAKGIKSGQHAFEAWVRADQDGQLVSLYSVVPAPSSRTSTTSWPPLVPEKLLASIVVGTNWTALIASVTMQEDMVLLIGVSKAGVIWLDDVSVIRTTDAGMSLRPHGATVKTDDTIIGDPAAALQAKIDAAIVAKSSLVLVAAGRYDFGNRTFLVEDAANLEIRAGGHVELIFWQHLGGVMFRRCVNVTFDGANASGASGFHVDRSPPPFAQMTVTKVLAKNAVEFTLDGDAQDPLLLTCDDDPSIPPSGGQDCTHTYWWAAGSRAPDGRPGSRGLPGGNGGAVTPQMLKRLGPKRYSATLRQAVNVGDQVVMTIWRGFTYVVSNSSRVITQDVAVHAGGYMAIAEMDGRGGHVYRRVQLIPRNGRLLSSNADGFHSSDMDYAPLFDNVHLNSMGDDYFNFQTSLLFVMGVKPAADGGQLLTVLHPHVSDQPDDVAKITDEWYGTTEPLLRVRGGEELLVYDPVTMTPMGDGKVTTAGFGARLLSPTSDLSSPLAKAANALYQVTSDGQRCKPSSPQPCVPYNFPSFTKQHYPQQRWRASVYEVALDARTPLPLQARPGAMAAVSYVLQISKTQSTGARVINSLFEDSTAFFGRWKSSHSLLQNCTFRTNGNPELEMQLIGSFYEGPITITNVSIKDNFFEVNRRSKEDGTMRDIITMNGDGHCCNVTNLHVEGNTIKLTG